MLRRRLLATGYTHNVWLTLLYKVSNATSASIWSLAVLSTYIQMLEGDSGRSTQRVGYAQAIQGACMAAAALPMGWLSDHVGRSLILKGTGVVACIAIACTCTAVLVPAAFTYRVLCAALALWGVAQAASPVVEALFADSVPTGSRSSVYTTAYGSALAAASIGPLLTATMFWLHGNVWELSALMHILLVGQAMALLPTLLLFGFSDAKSLGSESEGVLRPLLVADRQGAGSDPEAQTAALRPGPASNGKARFDARSMHGGGSSNSSDSSMQGDQSAGSSSNGDCEAPGLQRMQGMAGQRPGAISTAACSGEVAHQQGFGSANTSGAPCSTRHDRLRCCALTTAAIPAVLAIADCIMGLASGMTIKFFPLFFKDEVGLDPMSVSLLYCAMPLMLAAFSLVAQRLSMLLGRAQVIVSFKVIGISFLVVMANVKSLWRMPAAIIPIYFVRTALMNSCYPLQKSILMDFVPKETRARWNSLDSVTAFGWSGSAALGGWLIHQYGYDRAFTITATIQSMACMLLLLLLPLVPRREAHVLLKAAGSAPVAVAVVATIDAAEAQVEGCEVTAMCEPLLPADVHADAADDANNP